MPSVVPCAATCWYILLIGTCLLRGASPLLLVVSCAWYRLISSCIVLSPAIGCTCLLVLSVVPAGCSCRSSCRVCCLWLSYRAWSGHRLAPVGTLRQPDWRPSGGGGGFFKEGGEVDRNQTRPHFYARGQKKCGFSAQTEVKQLRKRRKWVLWCDFG